MRKGDRAAILSENCHRYIETMAGMAKGGFILCTLNYLLHKDELAYILDDSGSSVLIFDRKFAPLVETLVQECKDIRVLVAYGEGNVGRLETLDYEDLIRASQPEGPVCEIEEEDTLLLVYTSGTTGRPKGVMLSQKNLYCDGQYAVTGLELSHDTVNLNIAPLFHVASMVLQTISTLYVGGTNITLRRFDIKEVLENIQNEKVTFTFFVPTMIYRILDYPGVEKYNLSSLRHVTYGAAPIFLDRLKKALEIFGPVLYGVYGLTEGTANITILRREDHVLEGSPERVKRLKSCGREHSGHEVRIVDEEGRDVQPGQVGEIIIRSEAVMKGYWNNHKATMETIRDGWLFTGDLATFDEDHYIYIVDRKKNMIISGGENIYPKEIEDTIIRHEGVKEVVVIGIPDKDWGETPKAIVVPKEGAKLAEEDIIQFCRANLSKYKCPKKVVIVEELPKTSIGKIDIKRVKEEYKEQ
jgi:acyl-CoA synthetase (AMP-forming)/AMP-acid ligase II